MKQRKKNLNINTINLLFKKNFYIYIIEKKKKKAI